MSNAEKETEEIKREGESENAPPEAPAKEEIESGKQEKDPVLKLLSEREREIERLRKSRAKLIVKLRKKPEPKAESEPPARPEQTKEILDFLFK